MRSKISPDLVSNFVRFLEILNFNNKFDEYLIFDFDDMIMDMIRKLSSLRKEYFVKH